MENRKTGRYLLNGYSRKSMLLLCYSALMAAGVYSFLALQIRIWNSYGMRYCMLDCMHAMEQSWNFGMFYLLLTAGIIASGRKAYTYPAFVLRYKSTGEIWNLLFGNVLKKSIGFSIVYSSIACLFSGMASYTVSNWDVQNSMFFSINKTLYTGKTVYVFAAFFLFNMIKTFLGAAVLLLLDSCINEMIWGYLLLAVPIILEWDILGTGLNIFYNLFSISQANFASQVKVICILAVGILLLVCVYGIGRKIWKEKEFYGATGQSGK